MMAQSAFCRVCLDDTNGHEKRYFGGLDTNGLAVPPYSWECVDAEACEGRSRQPDPDECTCDFEAREFFAS